MWNKFPKAIKVTSVLAVAATLIGASSSVGAFATTGSSSGGGDSSAVGSGGYANATVSYANAYVTGPTSQPVSATASSPLTAVAVARGSSASATTSAPASAPAASVPTVVFNQTVNASGSPAQTVQVAAPAAVTDPIEDAIDKIRDLGVDIPDLPDLPSVEGTAVKAAVLALLEATRVQTLLTITAARTASLAAIEHARQQVILAFADLDMPEEEAAMLAKIDESRDKAIAAFDLATATTNEKFDMARDAVLAKDASEFDGMPGNTITAITAAQLLIVQKLTQAQTALAAVAAQFV